MDKLLASVDEWDEEDEDEDEDDDEDANPTRGDSEDSVSMSPWERLWTDFWLVLTNRLSGG